MTVRRSNTFADEVRSPGKTKGDLLIEKTQKLGKRKGRRDQSTGTTREESRRERKGIRKVQDLETLAETSLSLRRKTREGGKKLR